MDVRARTNKRVLQPDNDILDRYCNELLVGLRHGFHGIHVFVIWAVDDFEALERGCEDGIELVGVQTDDDATGLPM